MKCPNKKCRSDNGIAEDPQDVFYCSSCGCLWGKDIKPEVFNNDQAWVLLESGDWPPKQEGVGTPVDAWKVGDKYRVCDAGKIIVGEIKSIDAAGYHVQWSDGDTTVEDYPSPMGEGRKGVYFLMRNEVSEK